VANLFAKISRIFPSLSEEVISRVFVAHITQLSYQKDWKPLRQLGQ
jgi:hypothetical protein